MLRTTQTQSVVGHMPPVHHLSIVGHAGLAMPAGYLSSPMAMSGLMGTRKNPANVGKRLMYTNMGQ